MIVKYFIVRLHDIEVSLALDLTLEFDGPQIVSIQVSTLHELRAVMIRGNLFKSLTHNGDQHVQEDNLGKHRGRNEVNVVEDVSRVTRKIVNSKLTKTYLVLVQQRV